MKRNKINRKHPPIKARWHECFQTLEVKIQTYRERILRKLFGAGLFTLSALSAVSLASYDWWAVESNLPSVTNCNFLGVVGNAFAHGCYLLFGYAAWYIPLALLIGAFKAFALGPAEVEEIPNRRIALRIVGPPTNFQCNTRCKVNANSTFLRTGSIVAHSDWRTQGGIGRFGGRFGGARGVPVRRGGRSRPRRGGAERQGEPAPADRPSSIGGRKGAMGGLEGRGCIPVRRGGRSRPRRGGAERQGEPAPADRPSQKSAAAATRP